MKWQILVTSLVLSVAVSTQSFGFELLDRMLGINGCESKCCAEKAAKNDCSAKAKAAKNDCGAKAKAAKSGCNGKSATQKSATQKDATQKDATQKSVRSLIRKGCDDKKASDCGAKAAGVLLHMHFHRVGLQRRRQNATVVLARARSPTHIRFVA